MGESVLTMSHDEMDVIYEVDQQFYANNREKFTFYYGRGDKWVPVEAYHEMKETVASGNFFYSFPLPH